MNKTGLILVERKGDVNFFKDKNGKMYQELCQYERLLEVVDGTMQYIDIITSGYTDVSIKYNLNGIYGYSIWKGDICLEERVFNNSFIFR